MLCLGRTAVILIVLVVVAAVVVAVVVECKHTAALRRASGDVRGFGEGGARGGAGSSGGCGTCKGSLHALRFTDEEGAAV